MKFLTLGILILFLPFFPFAQKSPYEKFGKVTLADLQKKVYDIDSNAKAVILADFGSAEIIGNDKGGFSHIYKRHQVVHILDKSAYDMADVEIHSYQRGSVEDRFEGLKAVTYNLVDGKMVETKLEKSAIFKEQLDKNHTKRKFTFPGVKEGSIIEYEYEIRSDYFFTLRPWYFQGAHPRLWSEFQFTYPYFMNYTVLPQGYMPFDVNATEQTRRNFTISDASFSVNTDRTSFTATVNQQRWVIKNVPELKEESFTSTLDNHISKLEFYLASLRDPLPYQQVLKSWPEAMKALLADEDFGTSLDKNNGWMSDVLKEITLEDGSNLEKARKIYAYVRDNISCTDHEALYTSQNIKNTLKTKKGNVSDINLLLTAMLRYAGVDADPIILSTRDNGYIFDMFPVMSRFNYVISQASIGDKKYLLDASQPRLGFGRIPSECYNGAARVVTDKATTFIDLFSDSLLEKKITSVIVNPGKDHFDISLTQYMGFYESLNARNTIREKGKEEFFKQLKKSYTDNIELKDPVIDSLEKYEQPITLKYSLKMNHEGEDIIYFSPLLSEGYKENPFKSAERMYPVEMPYAMDETILLTLNVPEGYAVDEIPKQIRVKLNEKGEGMFEYLISQSGNVISIRCRVKLARAYFMPEEYDLLREFFNMIVSKQSEQIVLKKKK